MTDDERAAIAREVLTEYERKLVIRGEIIEAREIAAYRDAMYSVPAAPETVTVEGVTYTLELAGWAANTEPGFLFTGRFSTFLHRIAADARRIAELERENKELNDIAMQEHKKRGALEIERDDVVREAMKYKRERDEARRALEAATSQGEGQQSPGVAESAARPADSPAPIPTGAVVDSVPNDPWAPYTRHVGMWRDKDGSPWYDNENCGALVTALYHARHPVADAATVERVATLLATRCLSALSWRARAEEILRALGYTVEGA